MGKASVLTETMPGKSFPAFPLTLASLKKGGLCHQSRKPRSRIRRMSDSDSSRRSFSTQEHAQHRTLRTPHVRFGDLQLWQVEAVQPFHRERLALLGQA